MRTVSNKMLSSRPACAGPRIDYCLKIITPDFLQFSEDGGVVCNNRKNYDDEDDV